ncbi:hypothetical protein Tco_0213531 [Tanacetum coccineum]
MVLVSFSIWGMDQQLEKATAVRDVREQVADRADSRAAPLYGTAHPQGGIRLRVNRLRYILYIGQVICGAALAPLGHAHIRRCGA